jgi:hypothetical protein
VFICEPQIKKKYIFFLNLVFVVTIDKSANLSSCSPIESFLILLILLRCMLDLSLTDESYHFS